MSEACEKQDGFGKKDSRKTFTMFILGGNLFEGLKKSFQSKKQIMEFGSSYLYLNRSDDEKQNEANAKFNSPKEYSIKKYFPQVLAALLSAFMHLPVGMTMTFSAVLAAQLQKKDSDISVTTEDITWIASILTLSMPVGNLTGGFMIDKLGRLNTLKFSVIPLCTGWTLIALAKNIPMLIAGRIITGIATAWATNPAIVFITEISCPELRGSLVSIGASFATLGMAITYVLGWILPWRILAWLSNIVTVLIAIFLFAIPESPAWLVQKGRVTKAKKSLEWYYKYFPRSPENGESKAHNQLEFLVKTNSDKKEQHEENNRGKFKIFVHEFFKPTGYKPFLVLLGLFTFQQFSGIFVIIFYAVTFNSAVGAELDPYLTSTVSGFFRFLVTVVLVFLLKKFPKRGLIMASALSMAVFIGISGLFTSLIKEGKTTMTWIPLICNFMYFGSAGFGISSIPWAMSAEVYPLEIRGIAHSFTMTCAHLLMFLVIKSYYVFDRYFGGIVGVQYFFAIMSVWAAVYVYIFVPETKDKTLSEIEDYFIRHTIYLGNNINKKEQKKDIFKNRAEGIDLKASQIDEKQNIIENV